MVNYWESNSASYNSSKNCSVILATAFSYNARAVYLFMGSAISLYLEMWSGKTIIGWTFKMSCYNNKSNERQQLQPWIYQIINRETGSHAKS